MTSYRGILHRKLPSRAALSPRSAGAAGRVSPGEGAGPAGTPLGAPPPPCCDAHVVSPPPRSEAESFKLVVNLSADNCKILTRQPDR